MLCRHVCFVSNNVVADECDPVVLGKAALCMDTLCIQQKCDESALCVQQINVAKEIKFRSRYMMFVYHCNINNYLLTYMSPYTLMIPKLTTVSSLRTTLNTYSKYYPPWTTGVLETTSNSMNPNVKCYLLPE